MNSFNIADELDEAVKNVLAGVESAGVNTDLEMGELVGIAMELQQLPQPAFKAQLKAQLTGSTISGSTILRPQVTSQIKNATRFCRETDVSAAVLPSLFGSNSGSYPLSQRSMAASLFMHISALALVVVSGVWAAHHPTLKPKVTATLISLADYPLPLSVTHSDDGGGGDRDKHKASKGVPPPFAAEQFTPPVVIIRNTRPVLSVESTVIGPPEVTFPKAQIGDLYSKLLVPSNGIGFGGGIGDNQGTGAGPGKGPGVGPGSGNGLGGAVTPPRPIYDPEPEYSDEARLAKFQGDVLLWVVVGPDGLAKDIRVQRSLGMGLDEKAVAAVKNWRFQPALKDGQPVTVQVSIEVNFRLF
jgi:periplasmic protein TonB